jgi:hypothetical protein
MAVQMQRGPAVVDEPDGDIVGVSDVTDTGGAVMALQSTKDDLEALRLVRLDISPSGAVQTVALKANRTKQRISQVERVPASGHCTNARTTGPPCSPARG